MSRFLDRLASGPPLVADGGTGALLSGAVHGLRCPEEANLRSPESVVAVHTSYIAAGAELIETNTFAANRRKLARLMLDDSFEEINSAGVRLAREAREVTGRDVFVAGSIGPLGELEVFDPAEHGPLYAEQARVLEGRGVDLFMVETFFDLEELVVAVEAVRGASSLPIVALLTFDDEAEITGGVGATAAAERLAALGVAAIGTNHGAGPTVALRALRGMRGPGLPLAALPNIGLASVVGGRVVYPHSTPDYFAEFAVQAVGLGARIVGGCCGTTPAQIAAVRAAFEAGRAPRAAIEVDEPEVALTVARQEPESGLARAFREGEWVVSVELDPPKGGSLEGLIDVARAIHASGHAGFVDVNDNPMARARMNALMTSATLQRETGIEAIPHVTPRDTTVMGLEGVLLGAHAEGIRNVLAVTGDPPHVGDYPGSRGVYEVDSIGVVQLLAGLNRGEDYVGKGLDAPTSFFIGVAVNPSAADLELELERFRRKLDAGAEFAMTQALFEIELLDRFVERLGGEWPIPVLVGVWPLRSHAMALRLHNEVPGISVPDEVLGALGDAGPDAPSVGLELARELVEGSRSRAQGIYVIPPFKQPLGALDLFR
ncbi:bifunctional homocysteine S-methyltransferase/methylenetetrahydrofolate reductase [Gaiella sp.]|uniref:bifunctional homocysteine S-methyltransferase/methylenetetrahydrofolate reductase n=1 Tax=Gaiella sp. TaxID=2663207 RepID=UPI002B903420|nr:bifunctional homocysteine S-methyltransferase/methylenetetrahydrofolate reductase [Gaiella sp.]HWO79658.1 bifunctional homocysteine S-methyltransferase/methylenetetrahydrofolate reductase [Gaiella sp.]